MKRFARIALSAIFVLFTQAGMAADFKVGVVDLNKVMETSPQAEDISQALKSEFKKRDEELVEQAKQLKSLEEKLARDGAVMSTAEAKRLEKDIRSRRRALNAARTEFREDANLRRNEAVNRLLRQVGEVVTRVGEDENVDVILTDGVAYFNKRVDLTEMVLQRLRDQHAAK